MYKLLRMSLLALPVSFALGGGGVAWAQGAGTNGAHIAPSGSDTRTPTQKRAGYIDDGTLPGDATKPSTMPQTAPMSDSAALPGQPKARRHRAPSTSDTATPSSTDAAKTTGSMQEGADKSGDLTHDQQNSDK